MLAFHWYLSKRAGIPLRFLNIAKKITVWAGIPHTSLFQLQVFQPDCFFLANIRFLGTNQRHRSLEDGEKKGLKWLAVKVTLKNMLIHTLFIINLEQYQSMKMVNDDKMVLRLDLALLLWCVLYNTQVAFEQCCQFKIESNVIVY